MQGPRRQNGPGLGQCRLLHSDNRESLGERFAGFQHGFGRCRTPFGDDRPVKRLGQERDLRFKVVLVRCVHVRDEDGEPLRAFEKISHHLFELSPSLVLVAKGRRPAQDRDLQDPPAAEDLGPLALMAAPHPFVRDGRLADTRFTDQDRTGAGGRQLDQFVDHVVYAESRGQAAGLRCRA
jgi:hypothetical protein